jgi:hypothetical protein
MLVAVQVEHQLAPMMVVALVVLVVLVDQMMVIVDVREPVEVPADILAQVVLVDVPQPMVELKVLLGPVVVEVVEVVVVVIMKLLLAAAV